MEFLELEWYTIDWEVNLMLLIIYKLYSFEYFCSKVTFISIIILVLNMHNEFRISSFSTFSYGFDRSNINFPLNLVLLDIIKV